MMNGTLILSLMKKARLLSAIIVATLLMALQVRIANNYSKLSLEAVQTVTQALSTSGNVEVYRITQWPRFMATSAHPDPNSYDEHIVLSSAMIVELSDIFARSDRTSPFRFLQNDDGYDHYICIDMTIGKKVELWISIRNGAVHTSGIGYQVISKHTNERLIRFFKNVESRPSTTSK